MSDVENVLEEENEMKVLENISDFFGRYMALIVLVIAALALFVPRCV